MKQYPKSTYPQRPNHSKIYMAGMKEFGISIGEAKRHPLLAERIIVAENKYERYIILTNRREVA